MKVYGVVTHDEFVLVESLVNNGVYEDAPYEEELLKDPIDEPSLPSRLDLGVSSEGKSMGALSRT